MAEPYHRARRVESRFCIRGMALHPRTIQVYMRLVAMHCDSGWRNFRGQCRQGAPACCQTSRRREKCTIDRAVGYCGPGVERRNVTWLGLATLSLQNWSGYRKPLSNTRSLVHDWRHGKERHRRLFFSVPRMQGYQFRCIGDRSRMNAVTDRQVPEVGEILLT